MANIEIRKDNLTKVAWVEQIAEQINAYSSYERIILVTQNPKDFTIVTDFDTIKSSNGFWKRDYIFSFFERIDRFTIESVIETDEYLLGSLYIFHSKQKIIKDSSMKGIISYLENDIMPNEYIVFKTECDGEILFIGTI